MMTARQFLPRRLPYAAMICHVSCKKARKSARGTCKFTAMVQFGIVIIFASPLAAGVVVMVAGEEPPPGGVCASRGGVAVGRGGVDGKCRRNSLQTCLARDASTVA